MMDSADEHGAAPADIGTTPAKTQAVRASSPSLPLHGVRVLAVESFGAGPYGSMLLAGLGADVIKIENGRQGGDPSRSMGPYFLGRNDSEYFQCMNLNKRSCSVDLAHPKGKEVFHRLVERSDAVMNNLRGDRPEKLGIDYRSLRSINPRIVCAHVSAYGRDSERRAWPGYDYLMQAEAGFMHLTGEPGSVPSRVGVSMVDFMTGTVAALGLVSAVMQARISGIGRDVDTNLFEVALHQLTYAGAWYLNEGATSTRQARSAHASAVPVQLFPTKDGWLFVMCMTQAFWLGMLNAIDRKDLNDDPRFSSMGARRVNREALIPILDSVFARETTEHWLSRLRSVVPAAPVLDLAQALTNPFLQTIAMIQSTPHPERPDLRALANPIKLDGERLTGKVASALGSDTDDVLTSAGYTRSEIAILRADGAI